MSKTKLNFAKMNGLLPVIIQDYQNDEVLMLGFMNEEAWKLTQKTGKVHYYYNGPHNSDSMVGYKKLRKNYGKHHTKSASTSP